MAQLGGRIESVPPELREMLVQQLLGRASDVVTPNHLKIAKFRILKSNFCTSRAMGDARVQQLLGQTWEALIPDLPPKDPKFHINCMEFGEPNFFVPPELREMLVQQLLGLTYDVVTPNLKVRTSTS